MLLFSLFLTWILCDLSWVDKRLPQIESIKKESNPIP